MRLKRVRYGTKDTALKDREYKIDGVGPVGTIREYKEMFPNEEFEIIDFDSLEEQ